MSTQEIIAELPRLSPGELKLVKQKAEELIGSQPHRPIGEVLLELAGAADDLPPDYSINLDHYLHGLPKQQP